MRNKRLKKKHIPVDKSKLEHGCIVRFVDEKYLSDFDGLACFICGILDGTIVPAHIRPGWYGQDKPHDYWTMALCANCHALEGANPTKFWKAAGYTIKQIKNVAWHIWKEWKDG